MKETSYGKKGGEGPTRGKRATTYVVALPDGQTVKKRVFASDPPAQAIATGYLGQGGKPSVVVWMGEPAWEGDFGRLAATRLDR